MKYSQNDEQQVIADYFAAHGDGNRKFLDIGAHDGACLSNTLALREAGWKGVWVEPSPVPFASLLERHGGQDGVLLVNAAIAERAGLAFFHDASTDLAGSFVGSLDPMHVAKWTMAASFRPFLLSTITPTMLLSVVGTHFDFISLDVEGQSAKLFGLMVDAGANARCWCIEHDDQIEAILERCASLGLTEISRNAENLIVAAGIEPTDPCSPSTSLASSSDSTSAAAVRPS